MWQTGNRIVRSPSLGRETKPDIFCEWDTKFSIIPEILSKRVHSKRIPKFSKTLPGKYTVPFNFGPEISEFLVEWKAPSEMVYWCVWVLVRVFIAQRFSLLDKDEDGHLTEDDVMSISADVVDEAFGQTPPGEVRSQIEFSTQVLES